MNLQRDVSARSSNAKQEAAYAWVREAILTLQIRPGEPISDRLIAERLGISRTPVRDVLQRLSAEGLIEIFPRRGAFVKDINLSEMVALLQMREVNEGLAARLAAGAVDEETIESLRKRFSDILAAPGEVPPQALLETGAVLHDTILDHSRNESLRALLRSLRAQILRAQYVAWDAWRIDANTLQVQRRTTQEHLRILDAVAAGDGPRAEGEMRAHIGNATSDLLRILATKFASSSSES